ncbi:MAG TPA: hypothetical protein PKD61_02485 [Polyangiaceae bacterium]|nr:hypothetical protein [Polyangiaceae bacterium]
MQRLTTAPLLLIPLLLTGCPNVNTYGTARTTPKGQISHGISAEGWGFNAETETTDSTGATQTTDIQFFLPLPPSYHLRWGVADQVDLGFHVNNLSSLAFDTKVNLFKGRLDLALDPGVQWYNVKIGTNETETSINVFYFHGPVLIDFNASEALSFVLSPGVVYSIVSADSIGDSDFERATTIDGLSARIGLGLNIRASKKFAVHPEVTVLRSFGDTKALTYMAGISFNFGHLPSFDDIQ